MIGISYFKKNEDLALKILDSLDDKAELINLDEYKGIEVDELITVGGDGTFLKSISLVNFNKIIGIKGPRSIGGQCSCSINDWLDGLADKFKKKEYEIEERSKIKTILNGEFIDYAGNEVIISSLRPGRTLKYKLIINDKEPIETSGSMLFIYTPNGYGGFLEKLLNPYGLEIINARFMGDGIASIASIYGFNEYKELPENYEINIKIINKWGGAYLAIDGSKNERELNNKDEIKISNEYYNVINIK